MMKIEKYKLKNGQTGWQARIRQRQNQGSSVLIRRFSIEQFGEAAFHKALTWAEYHHDTSAHC